VPSQVSGFGASTTTGPVGVIGLPQASFITGGIGCSVCARQTLIAPELGGPLKSGYAGTVKVLWQVVVNGAQVLV
jgi:hypothetical protein